MDMSSYILQVKEAIFNQIRRNFGDGDLSPESIVLEKPPSADLGDFAVGCFELSKKMKKSPVAIACALAKDFPLNPLIESVSAVGPYINLKMERRTFAETICRTILERKKEFGRNESGKGKKVMVEYSSPNTNKPLHIGHVRNNLIGMALSNVIAFCGYEVIKANLINDRGIHICKSMLAYRKWGKGVTPKSSGKKGDHLVGEFYVRFDEALKREKAEFLKKRGVEPGQLGEEALKALKQKMKECKDKEEKERIRKEIQSSKQREEAMEQEFLEQSSLYQESMEMLRQWENGDPAVRELWNEMNDWVMEGFQETYELLGCSFDKIYRESETYTLGKEHVEQGVTKGIFERKEDGSIWIGANLLAERFPDEFKGIPLKDKLLLRADGTSVYITQDIGTAILKAEDFRMEQSIYVVASEQALHFKLLFSILKLLGFSWAQGCYHLAYGMVTLPHGMGKIKSREGTAVDADDLVEEMKNRALEKMREEGLRVPEEKMDETALSVALAALKVFILQVSVEKDIQFDPRQTIDFKGDTGPAIQYSYARIKSIFRKAQEQGIPVPDEKTEIDYTLLGSPEEYELVRHLYEFPEIVLATHRTFNIGLLVNYLLALTRLYATAYTLHPVLKAENEALQQARMSLAQATAQTLENGMRLLGASVPESM